MKAICGHIALSNVLGWKVSYT